MQKVIKGIKLALVVFGAVTVSSPLVLADGPVIVAQNLKGEARLMRGSETLPINEGTLVQAGDRLIVSNKAQLDIIWNKSWGYRLLGGSNCVLVQADRAGTVVDMETGDIIVNVKKRAAEANFVLQTPVAVAAVRGTQFWGSVKGAEGRTTLAVRDGVVAVTYKVTDETLLVSQGEAIDLGPEVQGLTLVRSAKTTEMRAMEQADSIMMQPGGMPDEVISEASEKVEDLNPLVEKLKEEMADDSPLSPPTATETEEQEPGTDDQRLRDS